MQHKLQKVLQHFGLTQKALAELTDMHYKSVHNYLKGRTTPDANFLERLCRGLNISPAWLLLGEGKIKGKVEGTMEMTKKFEITLSRTDLEKLVREHLLASDEIYEIGSNPKLYFSWGEADICSFHELGITVTAGPEPEPEDEIPDEELDE